MNEVAPQHVEIVEVAPRDGLQSDDTLVSTDQKVALINSATDAGIKRIEAVSFVNPKRVPQMADAEEVMAAVPRDRGVSYIGLVLNERGLERALETHVDEINVVVVATDTFAVKNQGRPTAELIESAAKICEAAAGENLRSSITVAASFGCPYEGEVSLKRLGEVLERLADVPTAEIALADSIGAAAPNDVAERVAVAKLHLPSSMELRCHFHNTRNTGIANAAAAVHAGVRVLDSSLAGIGGCPFAPNATGNIPTEDLVYMLHRMGHPTGIDLEKLIAAVPPITEMLHHPVPGLLSKAGIFPASALGAA